MARAFLVVAGLSAIVGGVFFFSGNLVVMLAILMFEVLVFTRMARRRKNALRVVAQIDDSVALINSGRIDDANLLLDNLAIDARSLPFQHSVIVYNRGVAALADGNPELAITLFNEVAAKDWFRLYNGMYIPHLHRGYAAAYLALGQLDQAIAAAGRTHELLSDAKRPGMLPTDAVILYRQHRYDEAISLLQQNGDAASGLLTPSQRRQVLLLEAFGLWTLGAEANRTRISGLVEANRPHRPRELLSLTMSWPEFAAFCDTHEIPWR
jgi:tetratricopeptide (TPR) repeat protein